MSSTDRLLAAIAGVCTLAVAAALAKLWLWFGIFAWLLLALELLLGFGNARRSLLVRTFALLLFVGYTAALVGMNLLHDPSGGSGVILGFPAGTALLIYGIWPLGVATTILVTVLFDSHILTEERVARLLAEHGPGRET